MAGASMAQSRTEEDSPAKADSDQPALDQEGGAPALNREVKQDLSKAPSSPDAPARKEEPKEPKEHKGPVSLQVFTEPEPLAEPTPE